jgi:hypothetical protein
MLGKIQVLDILFEISTLILYIILTSRDLDNRGIYDFTFCFFLICLNGQRKDATLTLSREDSKSLTGPLKNGTQSTIYQWTRRINVSLQQSNQTQNANMLKYQKSMLRKIGFYLRQMMWKVGIAKTKRKSLL